MPLLKDMPYEILLKELNLPTLEYHRNRGDMILLFKMLHKLDYTKMFTISTNPHKLSGNSYKLIKPRAN